MTVSLYLNQVEAEVVSTALGNVKTGGGTTVRTMTDPAFVASAVLYQLKGQMEKEQAKQEAQT